MAYENPHWRDQRGDDLGYVLDRIAALRAEQRAMPEAEIGWHRWMALDARCDDLIGDAMRLANELDEDLPNDL